MLFWCGNSSEKLKLITNTNCIFNRFMMQYFSFPKVSAHPVTYGGVIFSTSLHHKTPHFALWLHTVQATFTPLIRHENYVTLVHTKARCATRSWYDLVTVA